MLRLFTACLALIALAGCNVDVDGIKQEAEKLKNEIDSSNLKDCKDKDGKPLPDWVCRKNDSSEGDKPEQ